MTVRCGITVGQSAEDLADAEVRQERDGGDGGRRQGAVGLAEDEQSEREPGGPVAALGDDAGEPEPADRDSDSGATSRRCGPERPHAAPVLRRFQPAERNSTFTQRGSKPFGSSGVAKSPVAGVHSRHRALSASVFEIQATRRSSRSVIRSLTSSYDHARCQPFVPLRACEPPLRHSPAGRNVANLPL